MLERGRGKIINFSSTDGFLGVPEQLAYNVSKGAIVQLTRTLGPEWIRHGVNVNAVAPCDFATPMIAPFLDTARVPRLDHGRDPGRAASASRRRSSAQCCSSPRGRRTWSPATTCWSTAAGRSSSPAGEGRLTRWPRPAGAGNSAIGGKRTADHGDLRVWPAQGSCATASSGGATGCGRRFDTGKIPLEEYAAIRRTQLRYRLVPLIAGLLLLSRALSPSSSPAGPSAGLVALPFLLASWGMFGRPFFRARYRKSLGKNLPDLEHQGRLGRTVTSTPCTVVLAPRSLGSPGLRTLTLAPSGADLSQRPLGE